VFNFKRETFLHDQCWHDQCQEIGKSRCLKWSGAFNILYCATQTLGGKGKMRYLALACDYDETLACDGQVSNATLAALQRLVATGRKLILVSGRQLEDLSSVFPRSNLFEWVVAENGAVLYHPATGEKKLLANPSPPKFIARLRERGVPLSVGDAIVSTHQPHEITVEDTVRELGLELQVIFNKGAVMVLPSGTSKATGLAAALKEMGLSPHNVVALGDAENDHALLGLCECSVAVANALPMLQEQADFVTVAANGAGATELIDEIIASDLRERDTMLTRHHLLLGTSEDGTPIRISPFASNILLTGSSDLEKQNVAKAFIESLYQKHYQFCLFDPLGEYRALEGAVVLGSHKRAPTVNQVIDSLKDPVANAIVNLVRVTRRQRTAFIHELLARIQQLRARVGHPHWIVVNEAHQVLSRYWQPITLDIPQQLEGMMCITGHPSAVARSILSGVNISLTLGPSAATTLTELARLLQHRVPEIGAMRTEAGEAIIWLRDNAGAPFKLKLALGVKASRSCSSSQHQRDVAAH
jgi:HAD superfamily hydrolase (TIGR01484 family)